MNDSLVNSRHSNSRLAFFHIDTPLLLGLLALVGYGLLVLYSASGQSERMVEAQIIRLGVAFAVMIGMAQISPLTIRRWSLPLFIVGTLLLVAVLLFGHIGKGAQRWLDLPASCCHSVQVP